MGCNKFVLFTLNFFVFIAGATVVGLASVVIGRTTKYTDLLQEGILTLPLLVLIGGIIIGLIGFFGCCGALKENSCMLYTYAFIVLVLFIGQLVLGILVVVYQDEAKETTKTTMTGFFANYNVEKDEALAQTINTMQTDLHCCGVNNYTDWFTILHEPNVTPGCCKPDTPYDLCYKNVRTNQDNIYEKGCFQTLEEALSNISIGLGVGAIVLALIQLACIMISCGLARSAGLRGEYA